MEGAFMKETGYYARKKEWQNWFGLDILFNGIVTFVGYLMPKPSLQIERGTRW